MEEGREKQTKDLLELMESMKPDTQKIAAMVLEAFCNGIRVRDALSGQ